MKKAQGLPLRTVILAIIALIVLASLIYIFVAKGTTPFARGIGACEERGGQCSETCEGAYPIATFKGCYDDEDYNKSYTCCLPG